MFYYTYKITLLKGSLAGHYYYGQHRTKKLNDGYAGSGVKVSDYYSKYGKIEHQTYIKEIIAFYNSKEELDIAEDQLIGDKYITDPMCLNLVKGGWKPGCTSKETSNKRSKSAKTRKGVPCSEEKKAKLHEANKGQIPWTKGKPGTTKGKHRVYREDGSFYFN